MKATPSTNHPAEPCAAFAVAVFIPSLRGGGVERNMLNLTRGMAEAGCTVDLILVSAEGPFLEKVDPRVRVVDLHSRRVLTALPRLAGYLKDNRPDVLLSGMGHANTVAVAARWLARSRCRLVLSVHTLPSVMAKVASTPLSRVVPFVSRWFYPRADAVVAVSRDVKGDLVDVSHLSPDLITVIPNPVVTPELLAELQGKADHPFFQDGYPPVVLGIGRLSREKGFDVLIRAHELLLRETDARLLIVGEGEDRPRLEALVKELELEDKVSLPGFVDAVPAYIAAAAVVVVPSRIEGFGNALVEAMAGGVPVVATACPGGPSDILENGRYGPLVPVDDPAALAAAVARTLRDPLPAATLKARAVDFALAAVTARYLDIMGCRRTDIDQSRSRG